MSIKKEFYTSYGAFILAGVVYLIGRAFIKNYFHPSYHAELYLFNYTNIGIGFLIGCLDCYLIIKGQGLLKEGDKNAIENIKLIDDKATTGKRDQQHQMILAVINALNYLPLEIPTGGKAKIKEICLNRARVFTDSAFDHAWKDGTSIGLFKLLESDKFSSK